MANYNSILRSVKCCATCQFWDGERELSNSFSKVRDFTDGKCTNKNGRYKGWDRSPSCICPNYEKING